MAGLLEQTLRDWTTQDVSSLMSHVVCGARVWEYLCRIDPSLRQQTDPTRHWRWCRDTDIVDFVVSLMSETRFRETHTPQRCDVGVVEFPVMGVTCAICTGRFWASPGHRSVLLADGRVVKSWSVD